jgi:PAS domain-containing protein
MMMMMMMPMGQEEQQADMSSTKGRMMMETESLRALAESQARITELVVALREAQESFLASIILDDSKFFHGAVVICEVEWPHRIVACSERWSQLCGYTSEEAIGYSSKSLLAGKGTNEADAAAFSDAIFEQQNDACLSATAKLLNYTKFDRPFWHTVETTKIRDDDTGLEYYMTESLENTFVDSLLPTPISPNKSHSFSSAVSGIDSPLSITRSSSVTRDRNVQPAASS